MYLMTSSPMRKDSSRLTFEAKAMTVPRIPNPSTPSSRAARMLCATELSVLPTKR